MVFAGYQKRASISSGRASQCRASYPMGHRADQGVRPRRLSPMARGTPGVYSGRPVGTGSLSFNGRRLVCYVLRELA